MIEGLEHLQGETVALWNGDFGREYTERNRVAWGLRCPFWRRIVRHTAAKSVLEVGCNFGPNLQAIRAVARNTTLAGIDVNPVAVAEARAQDLSAAVLPVDQLKTKDAYDLVFTAGVLIHIAPDKIDEAMRNIIRASRKYVLAVEYYSDHEQEIPYRGMSGALWKRPFGAMYQARGLTLLRQGFLTKADGFDDCHYWLLEKPCAS